MKEIKYRAKCARRYYHLLDESNIHWKWCVRAGLWETSCWLSNDDVEENYGRISQYYLFKLIVPGQRGYIR